MRPPRPQPTALERAMRFLTVRGCSAAELTAKLFRAGYPPDAVEHAVSECRRLGFVNDELFARDCSSILAARGYGRRKIRFDLARRGIAGELAAEAMAELEDGELERATEAARFKRRLLNRESDPRKVREKLWRFLAGRGFSPGVIRAAVAASGVPDDPDGADDPDFPG